MVTPRVDKSDGNAELRRYTDVLAVLDTLKFQRITLLTSARWTDRNDRAALELYGDRTGCSSVLAYCMTEAKETFHHWQVFAGHGFGACIVFDKARLLERLNRSGLLHGKVRYRLASNLDRLHRIADARIPFLKREVFADEREYRIIGSVPAVFSEGGDALQVGIDLSIIRRVVLGPSIPSSMADTLQQIIRSFDGCAGMNVHHSRLYENQVWSNSLERLVDGVSPKDGRASTL